MEVLIYIIFKAFRVLNKEIGVDDPKHLINCTYVTAFIVAKYLQLLYLVLTIKYKVQFSYFIG